jgi:hypothetical protein
LVVGKSPARAQLTAVARDGELTFRPGSSEEVIIRVDHLVRWSLPVASRAADEAVLVDGSMLRLKPAWGKKSAFGAGTAQATAQTVSFGEVSLPRHVYRAVLWGLPPDAAERFTRLKSLLEAQNGEPKSDLALLENGDVLVGTITNVGDGSNPFDEAEGAAIVNVWNPFGETPLPLERVKGIAFSPDASVPPLRKDAVLTSRVKVGLRDGSLIEVDSLAGAGDRVKLSSQILGDRLVELKSIVSLQADGQRVNYLSDLEPTGYRSEPYLDLKWPYQRDQCVRGGRATVGGRRYFKALGMHSSSRLTYDVTGVYGRFAASIAIDDAAEGDGSVVFRVLLQRNGQWSEAFASGVVRGGEPARHVAVDLNGAEQFALEVDYADRGDERDYANWLDARLEKTE